MRFFNNSMARGQNNFATSGWKDRNGSEDAGTARIIPEDP
eukprot:CAMPEP_0173112944 /NCGR_PEP_ID=MMETSP1102-20130122/46443_1 /TAXON_ID=49646 /ORGANISM="Geminigera sp., Strain Caron Lab Isolate" /LENGTH=39 /DNA_ID= /DNA_START= /DNA_END= /DNA_ORIENTATION=